MGVSFNSDRISKWANDYEKELVAKHNLIADRFSLEVISGQGEYELPNYVTNIRSVLYLGRELHPKGFRAATLTGNTPFQTVGSIPIEYMFSGKGLRVLKLYPTPEANIAEYSGDLWTAAADEAGLIVEFYRTSDPTDLFTGLPDWVRRYVLKDYVCMKVFTSEGNQQDLRAATYYQGRMGQQEMYLSTIKGNMNQAIQRVLMDSSMKTRRIPARPVLPTNFGIPSNW